MIPAVNSFPKGTQQSCLSDTVSFQRNCTLGEINIIEGIANISYGKKVYATVKKHISPLLLIAFPAAVLIAWKIANGIAKAHNVQIS